MQTARDRQRRAGLGAALLAVALLAAPVPAHALDAAPVRLSIGVLGGSSKPDAGLADYQWETLPRAAWGAQALAGRGGFEAGMRLWRSATTQRHALPAGDEVSTVHWTSVEALGRMRLASLWGVDVLGSMSAGWLRLSYAPERMTIDAGGGVPVEVVFAPIDEWIAGAGMAFTRPLAGGWSAGLEVDRRAFRMDTAHRNGGTIEYRRDTFGDWSARFEIARRFSPW